MNAEDMKDPDILICPLMSCHFPSSGFVACRREKCAWWNARKLCSIVSIEDRIFELVVKP